MLLPLLPGSITVLISMGIQVAVVVMMLRYLIKIMNREDWNTDGFGIDILADWHGAQQQSHWNTATSHQRPTPHAEHQLSHLQIFVNEPSNTLFNVAIKRVAAQPRVTGGRIWLLRFRF